MWKGQVEQKLNMAELDGTAKLGKYVMVNFPTL